MKISGDDVMKVADLARLDIDDTLRDKLALQIGDILTYVDKLEQAETAGIAPTNHALSLSNAFREDIAKESPGTDSAIANAPIKENGCFVVPKIVG